MKSPGKVSHSSALGFMDLLGAFMLLGASLFFVLFTASINAPESSAGPMSMSIQWWLVVFFIDVILVLVGLLGCKLVGLKQGMAGGLSVLIGISILILGLVNQRNAPQLDVINNGRLMPVPYALNIVVYVLAVLFLMGGLFIIFRSRRSS
jgi:hypothetical protein